MRLQPSEARMGPVSLVLAKVASVMDGKKQR